MRNRLGLWVYVGASLIGISTGPSSTAGGLLDRYGNRLPIPEEQHSDIES